MVMSPSADFVFEHPAKKEASRIITASKEMILTVFLLIINSFSSAVKIRTRSHKQEAPHQRPRSPGRAKNAADGCFLQESGNGTRRKKIAADALLFESYENRL